MAVRTQDHAAASGHHFAHVLVNDGAMGGHEDAAVFLAGRKAENMVILVDCAAKGAKAVVAVGQHIWQGKAGQAGRPCALDDADVGDVVGGQHVKSNPDLIPARPGMGGKDAPGKGVVAGGLHVYVPGCGFPRVQDCVVLNDCFLAGKLDHLALLVARYILFFL